MIPGDTVRCPLCGRPQVVFLKHGEPAIRCDHGEVPLAKPVAFDSYRALVSLGAALLLSLVALLAVGSCVRRAFPATAPSCPPLVCPLDGAICPAGCACVPRAPGDSVGVCTPCPA